MHATPPGGRIDVSTSVSAGLIAISVKDSGLGIPDAIKDRLFTPFATTKAGGTGLGLAIALRLVQQHGGTIQAGNVPGSGAVFEIQLPLNPCVEAQVQLTGSTEVAVGGVHGG
jgi:signal transduction histidine kinase